MIVLYFFFFFFNSTNRRLNCSDCPKYHRWLLWVLTFSEEDYRVAPCIYAFMHLYTISLKKLEPCFQVKYMSVWGPPSPHCHFFSLSESWPGTSSWDLWLIGTAQFQFSCGQKCLVFSSINKKIHWWSTGQVSSLWLTGQWRWWRTHL